MTRRHLLFALSSMFSLAVPNSAYARRRCGRPSSQGIRTCEAGIDSYFAHITALRAGPQYQSQWCWAACISMVFRYYGFRVSQARIVKETWGGIVNLPGSPGQILANLNRPWIDDRGRRFRVAGDVYSANPATAAHDLAEDMPLIIGTQGHAMVLTSLTYLRNQWGAVDVKAAVVRDPWPGRGRRILAPQEWYGTSLLTRIRLN